MESTDDIVGGIKNAMSRGISLKDAMQSFYNAGYKKEDIENAARVIQQQGVISVSSSNVITNVQTTTTSPPHVPLSSQDKSAQQKQIQSQYQQSAPPSGKLGWIILTIGLVIIASLAAILLIFFKAQLQDFFSSF